MIRGRTYFWYATTPLWLNLPGRTDRRVAQATRPVSITSAAIGATPRTGGSKARPATSCHRIALDTPGALGQTIRWDCSLPPRSFHMDTPSSPSEVGVGAGGRRVPFGISTRQGRSDYRHPRFRSRREQHACLSGSRRGRAATTRLSCT